MEDDDLYLPPRELDVMGVLWKRGSGTVAEVREELGEPLAYTSVLSALQTLENKGYVTHEEEGRAYRYFPVVDAGRAGGSALARIRDRVFQGSAELMFAHLISDEGLEPEELARMRRLLSRRIREAR